MKIKSFDFLNIASIIVCIIGLIFSVVGGAASTPIGIGINTNIASIMIVGMVFIVISLIAAIIGSVLTEPKGLNKNISTIALYLATLALMFVCAYLVFVIIDPLLNPING